MQKHYYDEFTAAVYEQEYSVSAKETLFYINIAEQTGGPILELGCGTGAILLPLVEKGFTVVGVDSSEFMLNVLKRKIERVNNKNKLKITLFKSRMEDFETSHQFNLIIIANKGVNQDNMKRIIVEAKTISNNLLVNLFIGS